MALTDCQQTVTVSRIKFEEQGKKVIILNLAREEFIRTRVDGCLDLTGPACDWIVTKKNAGDVLIELKGSDVARALEQLIATAQYWAANNYRTGKFAALVVCSQFPRISTAIQRAKLAFQRQYGAPLHVISRNRELEFPAVLGFKTL